MAYSLCIYSKKLGSFDDRTKKLENKVLIGTNFCPLLYCSPHLEESAWFAFLFRFLLKVIDKNNISIQFMQIWYQYTNMWYQVIKSLNTFNKKNSSLFVRDIHICCNVRGIIRCLHLINIYRVRHIYCLKSWSRSICVYMNYFNNFTLNVYSMNNSTHTFKILMNELI